MSRKHDRRHVLRLVFQMEFFKDFEPKEALEKYFESFVNNLEDLPDEQKGVQNVIKRDVDREFVSRELTGVYENLKRIDEIIDINMSGWTISRLSKTDLAILRLAVYEIFYATDVPLGVSVHEAVELAKIFSSDDAPSFINGILGQISESVKVDKKHGIDENGL